EILAWQLIEALAQHGEDKDDRNLPYLLWHGMATRWGETPSSPDLLPTARISRLDGVSPHRDRLDRAFAIARQTKLTQLVDWIYWYAATLEGEALNRV